MFHALKFFQPFMRDARRKLAGDIEGVIGRFKRLNSLLGNMSLKKVKPRMRGLTACIQE